MIDKDLAIAGIFPAKVLEGDRIYLSTSYALPVTQLFFEENGDKYPVGLWCAPNEKATRCDKPASCWVTFEDGDVKRPIILGFMGKDIKAANFGTSGGVYTSGNTYNGGYSTASGAGVINIQGPINDSRCTKYTNIEDVPQVFSFMNWSSISGHVHQAGDADLDEPLYLASTRNELTNKTISFNGVSDSGTSPVTVDMKMIGNCMMIATTKKFGKAGDYLYVHCTNGQEFACIKIDEKDETNKHGKPANEWGHWHDSNNTIIAIVELIVNSNGKNVNDIKVDYIVNCGSYMSNPDLASGDLISYAKSQIVVNNGQASAVSSSNNSNINNFLNQNWSIIDPIEHGPGTGTQCVELPNYYVEEVFGVSTIQGGYGNGDTYYQGISSAFPDLFECINWNSSITLQPGDIVSMSSNSQPQYGHVVIVKAVNGKTVQILDQGSASTYVNDVSWILSNDNMHITKSTDGLSRELYGVARPK